MSRRPGFLRKLAILTGRSIHQLVTTLPELRKRPHVLTWPHLIGEPSALAGVRAACRYCVASRLEPSANTVTVHATHERLVCRKHQRWVGSSELQCLAAQQFSIASCPDVLLANRHHKRLIAQWGRGPTRAAFYDAVDCLTHWSRWPVVLRNPDIRRRWHALGVELEQTGTPAEVATWYPNCVALTELVLQQRHQIVSSPHLSPAFMGESRALLSTKVIAGLRPSGTHDVFRYALFSTRPEPDTECETLDARTELDAYWWADATAPRHYRTPEGDSD